MGRPREFHPTGDMLPVLLTLHKLFLAFQGPGTVLLQSRGSRLRDVLSNSDVTEIAEAPAGALLSPNKASSTSSTPSSSGRPATGSDAARQDIAIKTGDAVESGAIEGETRRDADTTPALRKTKLSYASIRQGKVSWAQGEKP
jgi:hypothetical protein